MASKVSPIVMPASGSAVGSKTAATKSPSKKTVKISKDDVLADLHGRICRRDWAPLRHVEPALHDDSVVVPFVEVRTFKLGAVRAAPINRSPVEEAMWARIRYGPSALENPKIRAAIASGEFNLKSVETRFSSQSVVLVSAEASALLSQVVLFDRKLLRRVDPHVSHTPLLVEKLSFEQKEVIKSFPTIQLNHVQPRVSHKPVVVKSDDSPAAHPSPILKEVITFDKKKLRHVQMIVKSKTLVASKKEKEREEKKEEIKAEKKAEVDLKLIMTNFETLMQLGFSDKKRALSLLMKNGNDLVSAVEVLLDAQIAPKA